MDIPEIAELLKILEGSTVEEFEFEKEGFRLRIRKPSAGSAALTVSGPALPAAAATPASEPEESSVDQTLHIFKAPIVGTFYTTPKPDAPQFVKVGDRVSRGTVLCIIEAMKIFNQIESDVEGEIVRVLVDNGQPVEYGEPLFQVRLDS